jgi:hypothetical protein
MTRKGDFLLTLAVSVVVGCVGPTREPIPLAPKSAAANRHLILKETYIAGVRGAEYLLPYGSYRAEASDERGVYYRAPIPIKKRGLFGGALPTGESLVEGGIYLPSSSFQRSLGVWLYVYDEHGHIDSMNLPGNFAMTEGELWSVEPAEP